jgi:hypothetical protein
MQTRPSSPGSPYVLIAVVAGVTWLALIGGVLSSYILGSTVSAHLHSLPSYAAYDELQPAPTSFGTVSVTRADMLPSGESIQVDVNLHVVNTQDVQADAPRIEDLRLINSLGADVNAKPGKWSGPASVIAHSDGYVNVEFVAPRNAGLLWLEYRDPLGEWPIRVALETTDGPQAAGSGDSE